jgi:hypothetical protein
MSSLIRAKANKLLRKNMEKLDAAKNAGAARKLKSY